MDMQELGFTRAEIEQKIINTCVEQIFHGHWAEEDHEGESFDGSRFAQRIRESVQQRIDERIDALAEEHVLPNVSAYVENVTLQKTTEWGEARGEPMSFVEYLIQRAEAYLVEEVDFNGKTRAEAGGFSFRGAQTRITHLVDEHLQYSIAVAMKTALADANSQLAQGIADTCKAQIGDIVSRIKVQVPR